MIQRWYCKEKLDASHALLEVYASWASLDNREVVTLSFHFIFSFLINIIVDKWPFAKTHYIT